MTPEHKQQILPSLKDFWKLDIDSRIAEAYIDFQDLSTTFIGHYSVAQFVEYSEKAIKQLEQILKSNLFSVLPFQYQFQNDFGSGNLRDDLINFIFYCSNNQFDNAVTFLYRLVYYQVQNGLWNKEQPINKESKNEEINKLHNRLNLIAEQLRINSGLNQKLIAELKEEKSKIVELVSIKNQELSEISNLLPTSRSHSEEITRLMTSSTDLNQQIKGLLNQQNSNLETINSKLKNENIVFENFELQLNDLMDEYKTVINNTKKGNSEFENLLENIINKSSTFENRLLVLNEIIGKEGAVKLFSTFNDRKKELAKPVKIWAIIVFVTGIIALLIIVAIFTNIFGWVGGFPNEIDWHYLVINSVKSLPIMVVLFFTIKQYAKERGFQEEYAFRSAIALTIQAYGDIAGVNKDDLISKAVACIYAMPALMRDKSPIFSFRSRDLTESLKELSDVVKNSKS